MSEKGFFKMKIVVQRSLKSSVIVNNKTIAAIDKGMVLLVCLENGDQISSVKNAAEKIGNLRIFEDSKTGKMNNNIKSIDGEFLCISQFTLSWDGSKGNRPSFDQSMEPKQANDYFEIFCSEMEKYGPVKKGIFAADMKVKIENDGPVTFSLNF